MNERLFLLSLTLLLTFPSRFEVEAQSLTKYVREHRSSIVIDTPPIDGTAERNSEGTIHIYVGQIPEENRLPTGLARAVVRFHLPAIPDNHFLQSATLGVYLEGIHSDSLSPSLGPLIVFHNASENRYEVNSPEVLADLGYAQVSEIMNLDSAFGQYHYVDVTQAITQDYLTAGIEANVSFFGLKADGLQWRENGTGYYHLSGHRNRGPELTLQFEVIPEPRSLALIASSILIIAFGCRGRRNACVSIIRKSGDRRRSRRDCRACAIEHK